MALKRCENGHYFDPGKYSGCPTCMIRNDVAAAGGGAAAPTLAPAAAAVDDGRTRRRGEPAGGAAGAGAASAEGGAGAGMPAARTAAVDDGKTQRLVRKQLGIDPVVGWLVCVRGPERGHDYRLHSEKNFIGRGEGMDVRIAGDGTISRENHASVSFDPKRETFRLLPGDGRGLVYLNDEEVVSPLPLKAGDHIELGETMLMFVPLCGPAFKWTQTGEGEAAG